MEHLALAVVIFIKKVIANISLKFSLQSLKETLARLVPEKRSEVQEFRKQHGDTKIGDVTVGMVCTAYKQLWKVSQSLEKRIGCDLA